jgi:hypothetical protein
MDCWNDDRRSLTIETSRLTRRLAIHVRVSCYRTSLSLCSLLGWRHRKHEPVASEKLHSFIAGFFICETQLNAPDLESRNHDVDIWSSKRTKWCDVTYLIVLAEITNSQSSAFGQAKYRQIFVRLRWLFSAQLFGLLDDGSKWEDLLQYFHEYSRVS